MAKHQNVLRGRWENLWASEATSVVELVGTDDILAKMTYALTNPVKDGLIDRADQWPGATSLWANLHERAIGARRPSRFFRREGDLPESITLDVHRPPGVAHLDAAGWRSGFARSRPLHAMNGRQKGAVFWEGQRCSGSDRPIARSLTKPGDR